MDAKNTQSSGKMHFPLTAYQIKARLFPSFVTIVLPILIFNHFYASEEFAKFVGNVLFAKISSNVTIVFVALYFMSEIGRLLGKHIFERSFFNEEKHMPTTNMLLYSDKTYSETHKDFLRKKIYKDFKVKLLNKEEELSSEDMARTKIVETMALIRKRLHSNQFLLQHNIEYGAARNAIGGAVIGAVLSIINILFFIYAFRVPLACEISTIMLIVYILIILFSKIIIDFYGRNYAKILFREYLS